MSHLSKSYISELQGNAHQKTRKWSTPFREYKKNKNSEKNFNKFDATFTEGKQKVNSFKINLWKNLNFKGELNNKEQLHMKYWEMDIEKVNEFNFLNE